MACWMLLFLVHFLVSSVLALGQESIYTSSISYCAPPTFLAIQKFDVRFFKHNSSIVFDISAESLQSLNVSGHVSVNAYGLKPFNQTFNLCDISSILCPLPQYHFNGTGTVPIPPSYAKRLPGVAYKLPNLEAYVQLTLTQISDGRQIACVQSTLSNGWSTKQIGANWGTGILALVTLLSSIYHTARYMSTDTGSYVNDDRLPNPAMWRIVDLVLLCQHIVATGLLDLNVPIAFAAFTHNFSWAFGLFPSSKKSAIQSSINNLRVLTGSSDPASAINPITYINRASSPYSQDARRSIPSLNLSQLSAFRQMASATPIVLNNNTIDAGIPTFVNAIGISTNNAYMSAYLVGLIFIASMMFVYIVGYITLVVLARQRKDPESPLVIFKHNYLSFVQTISIRLAVIFLLPATALAFFQWTLRDAWLPTFLSVLMALLIWALLAYSAYIMIRRNRTGELFERQTFNALGALYEPYRATRWFFSLAPVIPALLLKAMFIAFAKRCAWVQVMGFIIVDLASLIASSVLRPHLTKRADVLSIFLSIVRVVSSGLLIAFIPSLSIKPIPRVAIGFVLDVLYSVAVIIMFFNMVFNIIGGSSVLSLCRRRKANDDNEEQVGVIVEDDKVDNRALSHQPSNLSGVSVTSERIVTRTSLTTNTNRTTWPARPRDTRIFGGDVTGDGVHYTAAYGSYGSPYSYETTSPLTRSKDWPGAVHRA